MKTDYDFIEIGTAFFDTLIEKATDEYGLSVEPIKEYLDKLPNKPNVTKIEGAVVANGDSKDLDVYYVTEEDIDKHKLGEWMKGCNSVGKPHDFHLNYFFCPWTWSRHKLGKELPDTNPYKKLKTLPTHNLIKHGLVKTKKIDCYYYSDLIKKYSINTVKKIKIDTEGYDCKILNSILDYYQETNEKLPIEISFESGVHNIKNDVELSLNRLISLGYTIEIKEDGNVIEAKRNR